MLTWVFLCFCSVLVVTKTALTEFSYEIKRKKKGESEKARENNLDIIRIYLLMLERDVSSLKSDIWLCFGLTFFSFLLPTLVYSHAPFICKRRALRRSLLNFRPLDVYCKALRGSKRHHRHLLDDVMRQIINEMKMKNEKGGPYEHVLRKHGIYKKFLCGRNRRRCSPAPIDCNEY